MDSQSKWQELQDEFLIPAAWGWSVMVAALYLAVVVLH